jgi:hypothetical protein
MSSCNCALACPKTTGSIAVTRSSPMSALTISPEGFREEVAKGSKPVTRIVDIDEVLPN